MASGLAVVAFDHAAAKELITHDVNGRLVSPGDEQGFIEAASELCGQPELFARLGGEARKRASSLSWSHIGDRFLAHLIQVQGARHAATHTPSQI